MITILFLLLKGGAPRIRFLIVHPGQRYLYRLKYTELLGGESKITSRHYELASTNEL